jgi:hypothetical protein
MRAALLPDALWNLIEPFLPPMPVPRPPLNTNAVSTTRMT